MLVRASAPQIGRWRPVSTFTHTDGGGGDHKNSRTDLHRCFGLDGNGRFWSADEGPLDLDVVSLVLHVELQLRRNTVVGELPFPPKPQAHPCARRSVCARVCASSFTFLDTRLASPCLLKTVRKTLAAPPRTSLRPGPIPSSAFLGLNLPLRALSAGGRRPDVPQLCSLSHE